MFSTDGLVLRRQSWAKPRRAPARGTLPSIRLLQLAVPFGTPGDPARRLQSGLHVTLSNARITTGNPPSTLHGIFGGPLERVQEHTPRETLRHIQSLGWAVYARIFGGSVPTWPRFPLELCHSRPPRFAVVSLLRAPSAGVEIRSWMQLHSLAQALLPALRSGLEASNRRDTYVNSRAVPRLPRRYCLSTLASPQGRAQVAPIKGVESVFTTLRGGSRGPLGLLFFPFPHIPTDHGEMLWQGANVH